MRKTLTERLAEQKLKEAETKEENQPVREETKEESKKDNILKETIKTTATGTIMNTFSKPNIFKKPSSMVSGINGMTNISQIGIQSGISNNTPSKTEPVNQSEDQVIYRIKFLDLTVDGEKLDPKDIDFQIRKEMGEHDFLEIKFSVETEKIGKYMAMAYEQNLPININANRITETGVEDFKRIFMGLIREARVIRTMGKMSKIEMIAKSNTILMDEKKKFRSFQNPELTYADIIDEVMEEYGTKIENHKDTRLSQKTGRIFMQADMTDWEFLKYMLSTFGDKGMPLTAHLSRLVCGFIDTTVYDVNLYNTQFAKKRINQNLVQEVKGTDPYNPIETVLLHSQFDDEKLERIVSNSEMWIEQDILQCKFECIVQESSDSGFNHIFPLLKNNIIKGQAIEARVIEVDNQDGIAVMKLNFTEGLKRLEDRMSVAHEDKHAGGFKFPYTTPYSQSNTGFFCTPEVGDMISVYFPNANEVFGYVQGAVNNGGNGRFSNPNIRNYTIEDANITLNSGDYAININNLINMNAKKQIIADASSITLNSDKTNIFADQKTEIISSKNTIISGEINQITDGKTNLNSGGVININSDGNVKINS